MSTKKNGNEKFGSAYTGVDCAALLRRKGVEGARYRLLHQLGLAHQEITEKMPGAEAKAIKELASDAHGIKALERKNEEFFDSIDTFASELDRDESVPIGERIDSLLPLTHAALNRSELARWEGARQLRLAEYAYRRATDDRGAKK